MNSWLVWAAFAIAFVVLGFVGYHFAVRTLRFVTAALAAAVVVFVTRYGVTHPARAPADLVSSFTRGFNALSAAFFQPLLPGHHVPVPGRVGWLIIGVVLAFAYRELEVWAMRWQPPTVDMSALGGDQVAASNSDGPSEPDEGLTDAQRHDRLVAELRFRLPAVEVRAPAILPGGTKPNGLASIAENSGVTGSGLAGAIIRFFGMLWPNPRRYQVRVWIEHGPRSARGKEHGPDNTRVTVDLEDPRTGGSIATKTLVATEFDQAASVVAGYVARHIFRDDPTAPPWCVSSSDGDDLAAMLVAGQQRILPGSPDDVAQCRLAQIAILEKCRLEAGVARYELAQLYDLDGHHVRALRLHAVNREKYRRFYRGRYRLGMSLEMIANPEFRLNGNEERDLLLDSLRSLYRCGVTDLAPDGQEICSGQVPLAVRKELLRAAQNELRVVRQQLTLWSVIWAMFWHRDERAIRRSYFRLPERQRFHDGARVAELLVAVRQRLIAIEEESDGAGTSIQSNGLARTDIYNKKRATHIAAVITGDDAEITALLDLARKRREPSRRPGANAERTRWLPWQRRTPSWQAAYNAACLYAALEQSGRYAPEQMAERAVTSLTRAVNDRDSEMERPWDWIFADPDFSYLKSSSEKFRRFLDDQERKDYPAANFRSPSVRTTSRPRSSPARSVPA